MKFYKIIPQGSSDMRDKAASFDGFSYGMGRRFQALYDIANNQSLAVSFLERMNDKKKLFNFLS